MEPGLPVTADSRLITFNTLALNYQDDAYTLAYYFLGDERCAEQATQAAFDQLYRKIPLQASRFRLEVLRRVLSSCQQKDSGLSKQAIIRTGSYPASSGRDDLAQKLLFLNYGERGAVVLVDMLGLSYDEAAQVLGSSRKQVGKLLAQARLSLSQVKETQQ